LWRAALQAHGYAWHCFSNRHLAEEYRRELQVIPAFPFTPDVVPAGYDDASTRDLAGYVDLSEAFAAACRGAQPPLACALDPRLTRLLGKILDLPARHLPMPTYLQAGESPASRRDIDLGLLGEFRPEHGSETIPAMLAEVARNLPGRRFLVQVRVAAQATEFRKLFADAGREDALELVVGELDRDGFRSALLRCALLLLGYQTSSFRIRASGVLSDAASLGVPVIVPEGTLLADRVADGSATGHVYSRLDASTLRSMLDVPAEQQTALLARAAQAAAA
jgi:glycosyltransferase involved in cell wall biosynthesis